MFLYFLRIFLALYFISSFALCWNLCSLKKKYRQESLLFNTGSQRFAGILKSCLLNSSTSAEKQHCSLLLYTLLCLLWTWHKLWRSLTGSLFSFSFFFFFSLRYSVWVYVFSSVQTLSHVRLFATPWVAARQASLSITNSRSSLKLMSIESVMPSSHLILCLLLPSIPLSIRVFQ